MFSLRSWAEHVAASSQISMCFPFAFPFVFQVPAWVVLPSSNDDAFGILQPTWYYDFKISVYCVWRPFERHSYSTKVAFQHKNTQNLTPFLSACLCYCCKAVSWASLCQPQVIILTPRCFNLLRPEKVSKSYFGFFLETNFSRNWAHILSSRSASFQPF